MKDLTYKIAGKLKFFLRLPQHLCTLRSHWRFDCGFSSQVRLHQILHDSLFIFEMYLSLYHTLPRPKELGHARVLNFKLVDAILHRL